jgi:hypothetical protein
MAHITSRQYGYSGIVFVTKLFRILERNHGKEAFGPAQLTRYIWPTSGDLEYFITAMLEVLWIQTKI